MNLGGGRGRGSGLATLTWGTKELVLEGDGTERARAGVYGGGTEGLRLGRGSGRMTSS